MNLNRLKKRIFIYFLENDVKKKFTWQCLSVFTLLKCDCQIALYYELLAGIR